ncbi:MAG TPA: peroxiredoxin [Xanthomonadales bacterium]|nr:peroxiredoxin [Xanthomonadales bacterium]
MLQVNDKAPDFTLEDEQGAKFTLSARQGEKILLVFYPGDNTPVCTRQLCDYRDGVEAFAGVGVSLIGISNDDAESHRKFKQKHQLPFTLLTDPDLKVASKYDSTGLMGMKRSVYLLDEKGVIRYRHVESVALFRRTRQEILQAIADLGVSGRTGQTM